MNCKFWGQAAKKFDGMIVKDRIVKMNNCGKIVISNKRYSSLEHNYEISVESADADIQLVNEADTKTNEQITSSESQNTDGTEGAASALPLLPKAPCLMTCKYSNLRSLFLSATKLPYIASVIGIIHDLQPTREIQVKRSTGSAESTTVRNMLIVDPTKHSVDVSLWGLLCEQHPYAVGDVIYLQSIQVKQNSRNTGLQFSTIRTSEVHLNPEQHTSTALYKEWYHNEGLTTSYKALSDSSDTNAAAGANRTLIETDLKGLQGYCDGTSGVPMPEDTGLLFKVSNAFITDVAYQNQRTELNQKFSLTYDACVSCNKKVTDQGTCPSCSGDSVMPKLGTVISLSDVSASNIQVRAFTDQLQTIFGRQARQIKDLIESDNVTALKDIVEFNALWRRGNFVVRGRKDMYNNQIRVNLILTGVQPINHNAQVAQTMKSITQLLPDAFDQDSKVCNTAVGVSSEAKRLKIDV